MNAFILRDFDAHLRRLETVAGNGNWLAEFRRRSYQELSGQGLPTVKTEDWKYTKLRDLLVQAFVQPRSTGLVDVPRCDAEHVVVMVNGHPAAEHSRVRRLPEGVSVTGMKDWLDNKAVPAEFGGIATHQGHPFAALNSALFDDGLMINVAPGVAMDQPLVVLWLISSNDAAVVHPRLLVRLGAGAQLALVEQHLGGQREHLVNKLGELSIGDGGNLIHLQLQQTGGTHLINGCHVRCGRDSSYNVQNFDLGGALIRNDLMISMAAAGADVCADGLFLTAGGEQVDNHVRVDHLVPRCRSRVFYKGLLGEEGCGVFNGKLIVHTDAQKTDARQVNHNLLLSPHVEIDTKPELEIYADDVQCSHGCTTGEMDPDQLFYLRARGIPESRARKMLVDAFAGEMLDRLALPVEMIAARMQAALARLVNGDGPQEDP
ncbi:MAG: Fe-S cluster assembly protein SufD [Gammaproteobacteria bacterium]|nr:MAG: Fe-S cluster assembly protein SufD [Gammaproteobacteria bacterium]